jgi:nitric oxide reductase NorQ protein
MTIQPEAPRAGRQRFLAETPNVREIVDRGLLYLSAGLPLHLCGPAGTGKTTLALHLAERMGRPCTLIQGDEQMTSTDLVRGPLSVRHSKTVDNYIRSVVRTAENYTEQWSDGWLAAACKRGHTLVYDEFTRSRAEANNVLLSVLEERVLFLPTGRSERTAIPVHPEFRLIVTSNPIEYAGVHRAADALVDRLATIRLDYFDEDTETAIVGGHTGLPEADCRAIVRLVRAARAHVKDPSAKPSLRSAVKLGQVVAAAGLPVDPADPRLVQYALDVIGPAAATTKGLAHILAEAARGKAGEAGGEGRGRGA